MGIISIQQRDFDIDCIVFDKDDTLVEFDVLWGPRTQQWVEAMALSLGLTDKAKSSLFSLLGYFPKQGKVRPESPLAVASIDTLAILAAGVICQQGIPWHEAYASAKSCAQNTILAKFNPEQIRPKGNVEAILRQISLSNIRLAVVTSDNRLMTEATLDYLGVIDLISVIVCADDSLPNKPAPDAFWLIANKLGIQPNRMMMVGDTVSDMQFADNAGAAFRVGINALSGNTATLLEMADVVVSSIDEFEVR